MLTPTGRMNQAKVKAQVEGKVEHEGKVKYFHRAELEESSSLIREIWRELNSLVSSLSRKSWMSSESEYLCFIFAKPEHERELWRPMLFLPQPEP